jgi:hypothetical protein
MQFNYVNKKGIAVTISVRNHAVNMIFQHTNASRLETV